MANDTSKTAKITKRLLPTSTSPKCQCTAEKYHLFAIFAVLDVSFVVNSCLNRNFLHLLTLSKSVAWNDTNNSCNINTSTNYSGGVALKSVAINTHQYQ